MNLPNVLAHVIDYSGTDLARKAEQLYRKHQIRIGKWDHKTIVLQLHSSTQHTSHA